MGYTHYFPGLMATAEVIDDARKIIDNTSVTVCGPKGQGLPILDETEGIRLNGSRAAGEAYETFHLRGTKEPHYPDMWTFCKTEQKPYDEVVTAILIAAAVRLDGPLRSDGRWDNWAAGVELFERAVRPLTEDEKIALELDVEAMRPQHLAED
ncbi:hypothetical protein B1A87_002795 [Arthrobacter sp. KBS0703]|uniref:hypothetical protein n=1 Tax=Arthrobacter sp. KBS0703 TaxID=1955698 RepID=UPI00098E98F6|nr:hypothetical protein [Arthrobacter sp. KBS0703]TSE15003.1 hypothetical protein B1A87_002795 [Arthrobacter sp. KBS0703]